jgi:GMP synthase-like glutamine amidotransferase
VSRRPPSGRGLNLVRVELDEGEGAPDWREFDGLIVMGGPYRSRDRRAAGRADRRRCRRSCVRRSAANAYGLRFHLEVPPELAREWAGVPAYAESLERERGPGAPPALLAEVESSASATLPLARSLFGRWL